MRGDGPLRAILFDLDGTVLDSAELIITAFRQTCRARLGRDIDRGAILRAWSLPIRQRFRALAPDQDEEELAREYLRRYLALHDRHARLYPAIPRVLDGLRERGYPLGVVTSKRRTTTRAAVDTFGLDRWFSVYITDEDVTRHKPDPEPVKAAASRLGVPPAEVLMVGDSPLDVAAGKAAGAWTAGALWGAVDPRALRAAGPTYLVEEPEELLSLA